MKARILIVEDDKHIFKLVRYNLEKAGFECIVTVTGEEALEILDKESINLIILDIMLPKMDGYQVCNRLKSDQGLKDIPIIMLTSRGKADEIKRGLDKGADAYITKPFNWDKLSGIMSGFL